MNAPVPPVDSAKPDSKAKSAAPLKVLAPNSDEPRGALAATPPLAPTDALLEELERESQALEAATPKQILKWAVERFAPKFTMATAFGPEGMTIIHMLADELMLNCAMNCRSRHFLVTQ